MDDAAEGRGYGKTTFQARVSASISRSPLGGRCYSFRRFGAFQAPRTLSGHPLPVLETGTPVDLARVGAEGLEVPMITTELVSSRDPAAVPILTTAAKLSVPFLKPGYYHYKFVDVRKELAQACNQFRGLVELAQKCGVQVGFHNHAGYVGAQTWDIARAMDTLDPKWAGYYYDLENAAAEG